MTPHTTITTLLVCGSLLLSLGCSRGPRNFENDNDTLREQNLQLRRDIDELQQALERREGELQALKQQQAGSKPVPGTDAPTLTKLTLDRYSGPVDTDGDGADDVIRLYLKTADQHGRHIPIEALASATLVQLGDDNTEPKTVWSRDYDADAFRKTYRDGFTGTHYTLEAPLADLGLPPGPSAIAAKVTLTDAATGADHQVTTAYNVTR